MCKENRVSILQKKKRKISIPKTFVLYDTIWWLSCKITFCYSVSATRIENVMIRRPPYFSSSTTFVSNPLSVNEVCCQWKLNESYLESMLGKFECEMHSSLTNSNLLTFDRLLTVLQTGSVIHWKITFFFYIFSKRILTEMGYVKIARLIDVLIAITNQTRVGCVAFIQNWLSNKASPCAFSHNFRLLSM